MPGGKCLGPLVLRGFDKCFTCFFVVTSIACMSPAAWGSNEPVSPRYWSRVNAVTTATATTTTTTTTPPTPPPPPPAAAAAPCCCCYYYYYYYYFYCCCYAGAAAAATATATATTTTTTPTILSGLEYIFLITFLFFY